MKEIDIKKNKDVMNIPDNSVAEIILKNGNKIIMSGKHYKTFELIWKR